MTGFAFYRFIRSLFRIVAGPMFRLRIEGASRIPRRGPVVIVASHRSWLDPPCVGAACRRPIRFLILDKVYRKPWARWFYRWMRGLPVDPASRRSVASIRRALSHLKHGGVVGVFPEGRVIRGGEPAPFHPGAAMLALRSGAQVVPIRLQGTAEAWPHGRKFPRRSPVTVYVDEPLELAAGTGVDELTARIREAVESTP